MKQATQVMSTLIALLGVAIVVVGVTREDWLRVAIGLAFLGLGAGRVYLARRES